jgi:hypothetical protein
MRDGALANFQQELGNFAQQTAQAYNAQSNANAAYPPPPTYPDRHRHGTALERRSQLHRSDDDRGCESKRQSRVADQCRFRHRHVVGRRRSAGQYRHDHRQFHSRRSIRHSDRMERRAFRMARFRFRRTGTNGIVVQDDASDPSSRGGTGIFAVLRPEQYFPDFGAFEHRDGLVGRRCGVDLRPVGRCSSCSRVPNGEIGKQASVTVTAGMTIGDIVSALNTAFGGGCDLHAVVQRRAQHDAVRGQCGLSVECR